MTCDGAGRPAGPNKPFQTRQSRLEATADERTSFTQAQSTAAVFGVTATLRY